MCSVLSEWESELVRDWGMEGGIVSEHYSSNFMAACKLANLCQAIHKMTAWEKSPCHWEMKGTSASSLNASQKPSSLQWIPMTGVGSWAYQAPFQESLVTLWYSNSTRPLGKVIKNERVKLKVICDNLALWKFNETGSWKHCGGIVNKSDCCSLVGWKTVHSLKPSPLPMGMKHWFSVSMSRSMTY